VRASSIIFTYICILRARIAQSEYRLGYRLDDQGSIPRRGNDRIFSLYHCIQTGSGAHPAFYPVGTGGSFPRCEMAEA
jgi:hypothetical protein